MLVDSGAFKFPSGKCSLSSYIQPASIDLPVTGTIYLVKEKVLPFQQRVSDLIEGLTLETKSLSGNGAVLLKGQVPATSSPHDSPDAQPTRRAGAFARDPTLPPIPPPRRRRTSSTAAACRSPPARADA
jgi:hypothetical protein